MRDKRWFFFLIFIFLVTGCRPTVRSASTIDTSMVIVYQKEGGFAGQSQEWEIFPDGRINAPGGAELTAEQQDTTDVFTAAASDKIQNLADSYVPEDNCCDKFVYTIVIKTGNDEKSIETSDDVEQPPELTDFLSEIDQLITRATTAD